METIRLKNDCPLMLVDISVPRNVAQDCNELGNVKVYNVDELKAVLVKNTAMRQREVSEAENLLNEETLSFCGWCESLSAIPTINLLQEKANTVRQEELIKCTRKLSQNHNLNDKELEALKRLSRVIVNKLLHGPMSRLRQHDDIGKIKNAIKELTEMFQLETEANENRQSNYSRRNRR